MQNVNTLLAKFPLKFGGIPSSPEEDYIGGKTTWKDGKLVSFDYGSSTIVYIAHYEEDVQVYNQETHEPTGEWKKAVRAMSITVPNPVTRDKIIEVGRKNILGLMNVQEEVNYTNNLLRSYMNDPSNETIKTYEAITKWLEWELDINDGITPERAKVKILGEITEYDSSDNVNQFFIGGVPLWLPKDTRIGLVNSITMEKNVALAKDSEAIPMTTLWYGNYNFNLPCDAALQMLTALELYALECYNVTAQHKSAVEKLTTVDEILEYDYTEGYPEKLHFDM